MIKNKLQYRKNKKQIEFLLSQQFRKQNRKHAKGFGGELLLGKRKEKRPLSDKKPMHLIMRSDSVKVFTPTNKSLKNLIFRTAEKYSIKIYELALNHTHIHFVMKLKNKSSYNAFIRKLTSKMAISIRRFLKKSGFNNNRYRNLSDIITILTHRPFTRILEWGKDFRNCIGYVILNISESMGWERRRKAPNKASKKLCLTRLSPVLK